MRAFPVPVQITDEERLMGGIFSLRQTLYIILGLALGGAGFAFTFLPVLIRLFLFILVACIGVVFAFVKIRYMRVDQYIYLHLKWRKSPRAIWLKGEN